MLVVAHEMGFACEVGDSLIFMVNGLILEQGDPVEVIDTPRHERARAFFRKIL